MKTKVSILFYAKRAKASVNGLVPIYTRITINGKRIELSTNRFVEISKWSTEAGKMKGSSEEARSINSHLDMFKIKIIDVQMELIHKNIPITSETLKNNNLLAVLCVINLEGAFLQPIKKPENRTSGYFG